MFSAQDRLGAETYISLQRLNGVDRGASGLECDTFWIHKQIMRGELAGDLKLSNGQGVAGSQGSQRIMLGTCLFYYEART